MLGYFHHLTKHNKHKSVPNLNLQMQSLPYMLQLHRCFEIAQFLLQLHFYIFFHKLHYYHYTALKIILDMFQLIVLQFLLILHKLDLL